MPPNGYLSVKNFDRFQHYKDRNPVWIKLYNSLLDDYEFTNLPDASKWHMVAIFLLSSRYDNKIPYDSKWIASKISIYDDIDMDILLNSGMIVAYGNDSNPLASGYPREEKRREKEEKNKEEYSSDFEKAWSLYPRRSGGNPKKLAWKSWNARIAEGVTPEELVEATRQYAEYIKAKGKSGTEFVMQASTFYGPNERWQEEYKVCEGDTSNVEPGSFVYKKLPYWGEDSDDENVG